jgi:hypothetical protein
MAVWIWNVRHGIKRAYARRDAEPGRRRSDALSNLSEKPQAVLQWTAIGARARMRAEELMAKIAMALLHINEVETAVSRELRGADVVLLQTPNLAVLENGVVRTNSHTPVEKRMMVEDDRLRPIVTVRAREPAGVCQLQTYEKVVS